MRVCRDKRATSNLLCFNASIARSKRTLSGCLESTFAIGLEVLFLQPVPMATSASKMTSNVKRRDMVTPINSFASQLNADHSGFLRCLKQLFCVGAGVTCAEDGIASNQNIGTGSNHL